MDVNFVAAARDVLAGRAHVVFNVAGTQDAAGVNVFEACEDFVLGALGYVGDYIQTAAMAHADHQFVGAQAGASVEKFIDQRDQRGDAFEGEALAAEIALLHDLLEDVGADEQIEDTLLVFFCNLETLRRRFHLLVDPAAAFGIVDVVDLDADGRGVDGAGFTGVLAFDLQLGSYARAEEAERVEVACEVSPLAEGVEDAFAFGVSAVT